MSQVQNEDWKEGLAMDIEEPWRDMPEEEDWLSDKVCNTDEPDLCESCQ